MVSPSTHPSLETNLLSPITSWLTRVICLRPRQGLHPLSGQMQWHKGGPDAPLSSCWPLPLFQTLRKGPEVAEVLGTGHIAALIRHSVTIESNVWPPPLGLTPSWQAGKVMGASLARLPAECQDSSSMSSSVAPCSRWLTAAKRFSTVSRCTHGEEETEIMGGVRRRVTGGDTSSHQRLSPVVLYKQRGSFGALSIRGFSCWHPHRARHCDWLRRKRKKKGRDRISPLVNRKANTVEREKGKSMTVTQTQGGLLADVLQCIKDYFPPELCHVCCFSPKRCWPQL